MSKRGLSFHSFLLAFPLILQVLVNASGQKIEATIEIGSLERPSVRVRGRCVDCGKPGSRNFSFLRSIGAAADLGRRVSGVELMLGNTPVEYRKFVEGEYLAAGPFDSWSYSLDLSPRSNQASASSSWISRDFAVLMPADILPSFTGDSAMPGRIVFNGSDNRSLPLQIVTSEPRSSDGAYDIADVDDAVFYLTREAPPTAAGQPLRLLMPGEWSFSREEAVQMASEIYGAYRSIFGAEPAGDKIIALSHFPLATPPGQWQAETRGQNVTIISSEMPFKTQAPQRLHEQLRHEIFHLWLPNGVNLKGKYDWFYEGFALYESLKTGVRLNRIRFDDFLDTLSRAYEIDRSMARKESLLDASAKRWSGGDTQVYARGMTVAFLCDVELLGRSKGKRGIELVEREIYEKHRPPAAAADGSDAVLSALRQHEELVPLVNAYITGAEPINWTAQLALAGIEANGEGRHAELRVMNKLSGRQKTLLDKLGYNSWRKLPGSSK